MSVIPPAAAGIPEAGSVQEVLLWQTATIRMMYRIVAKAIERKGAPPSVIKPRLFPERQVRAHGPPQRLRLGADVHTIYLTRKTLNLLIRLTRRERAPAGLPEHLLPGKPGAGGPQCTQTHQGAQAWLRAGEQI